MVFDIKITTCSHASRCHHCKYYQYCNVGFVLFHNVTCYTNSLLSHIHTNTIEHPNITCTLFATSMILRSLECTNIIYGNEDNVQGDS